MRRLAVAGSTLSYWISTARELNWYQAVSWSMRPSWQRPLTTTRGDQHCGWWDRWRMSKLWRRLSTRGPLLSWIQSVPHLLISRRACNTFLVHVLVLFTFRVLSFLTNNTSFSGQRDSTYFWSCEVIYYTFCIHIPDWRMLIFATPPPHRECRDKICHSPLPNPRARAKS